MYIYSTYIEFDISAISIIAIPNVDEILSDFANIRGGWI